MRSPLGKNMEIKVTLVVNAHREGLLLWRALQSAQQNRQNLVMSHGVACDILIVADDPATHAHDDTLSTAQRFCDEYDAKLINTRHGDLGLARNSAIDAAKTEFVAFLDADDIWGPHWISRAYACMLSDEANKQRVLHPQLIVNFEKDKLYWQHTDSRSPEFDPSCFFITNAWTAHNFASVALYKKHPYRSVGGGYGFEDWEWNSRTLAAGVTHAVVPETCHFIRKRGGSMSVVHASQARVTRPNAFWDSRWKNKDATEPAKLSVGEWLIEEWKEAHKVEPQLWPGQREMHDRVQYSPPGVPETFHVYWRIKNAIPANTTHLILFAGWGGGADARAKHYADAVRRNGGVPALVATDSSGSMPKGTFIDASAALKNLSEGEKGRVVQRLMLQHNAGPVHVVNSRSAWMAVVTNAQVFKTKNNLYVSLYAFEHLRDGRKAGYAATHFDVGSVGIRCVITDNEKLDDDLFNIYAWDRTLVAPTPATFVGRKPRAPERVKSVLWAGAVDHNKNLDLLIEVAKLALKAKAPVLFTVHGDSCDYVGYKAIEAAKKLPNMTVHAKPFKGWAELQSDKYDVFAFTSKHEGFPNVVLEALSSGMPVVSTPAGGLKATVSEHAPMRFAQTAEEFLKAIIEVRSDEAAILAYLAMHNSEEAFDGALAEVGYFVAANQPATIPAPIAASTPVTIPSV